MPEGHPHAERHRRFPRLRAALRQRRRLDHAHYDSVMNRITRIELRLNQRLDEMSDVIMTRDEMVSEWLRDLSERVDAQEKVVAEATERPASLVLLELVGRLDRLEQMARQHYDRRDALLADFLENFSGSAQQAGESARRVLDDLT